MINPVTKNVTVARFRTFRTSENHVNARNGDLFVAYAQGTWLHRAFDSEKVESTQLADRGGFNLVEHEGWLYSFGNSKWDRINVETLEVEPLKTKASRPHGIVACAVSTFHGLVAFGSYNSSATEAFGTELAAAVPNLYQMVVKDKPLDK